MFSRPLKIFRLICVLLLFCEDTHHTATSREMNTTSCSSNILILLQFYHWGFTTIPTHRSNTAEILFYYLLLSMVIFLTFHATKNIVTFDKIIIILLTLLIHIWWKRGRRKEGGGRTSLSGDSCWTGDSGEEDSGNHPGPNTHHTTNSTSSTNK